MRSNSGARLASLAERFPTWDCWFGIDCLWYGRIRGATPPVMVRGEDTEDLADQYCDGNAYTIEIKEGRHQAVVLHWLGREPEIRPVRNGPAPPGMLATAGAARCFPRSMIKIYNNNAARRLRSDKVGVVESSLVLVDRLRRRTAEGTRSNSAMPAHLTCSYALRVTVTMYRRAGGGGRSP